MTAVNVQPPATRTILTPGPAGEDILTWEGLLALLRRYRVVLLLATALGGAIPAVLALMQPRTYTAISRFILNRPPSATAISGLASQIGLRAADGGGWDSPEFYADLARSREILWDLANTPMGDGTSSRKVIDFLGVKAPDSLLTKERAVVALRSSVDARVVNNGVVEVRVQTSEPAASRQMAEALLVALDRFILEARQTRSAAERQFTERRLRETQAQLHEAQNNLASFMERNRSYRNSPELTFRYERLTTEASLRQQLFAAATLAYEQARVEEIRDTPTMIIIERPDTPVAPDGRGLVRRTAIGAFIGFGLVAFLVLVQDFRRRMATRLG